MAVRRIITNRAKKSIRNLYWRSTRKSIQRKTETKSLVDAMVELVDTTPLSPSNESRGVLGIWRSKGYTIYESTHCFVRKTNGIRCKPMDSKKNLKRKWYFACVVDISRNTVYIVNAVFAKYIDRMTDNTPTAIKFMNAMKGVYTRRSKQDAERRQLTIPFPENESKKYLLKKLVNECVDRYLNEYLDRMTSNAMRSLGSIEEPSELAKDTHRYLRKDLYNPKPSTVGLQKNNWLIHITSYKNAMSIMRNGFMSRVKDLDFRATQDLDTTELENEGLCFACELSDSNSWGQITDEFSDNKWAGVIFQANGFNAQSFFGSSNIREIIFSTKSAHNFLLVLPMSEKEKQNYISHNEEYYTDDWAEGYAYCKVVDKNGKCVFKGELSHLFDRFKQPNQRKLLTPSYAENYLSSNLAQIHNRMWNPKK